jgi:hypothetical protein
LEEVYISHTGLTGGLPDVIPEGSPLRTLLTIGKGEPDSPRLSGEARAAQSSSPLPGPPPWPRNAEGARPRRVAAGNLTASPSPRRAPRACRPPARHPGQRGQPH